MFTDRFLKIPIKIFDAQLAELTDKQDLHDSYMKINPFEISQYKPTNDGDTSVDVSEFKHTYVSMKNGDGFYVYLSMDEFEKLLNTFS